MTRYAKGRRAEWRVRDLLQEAGAIVVRSAGSKSPADLVAMFPHRTYAVQVKCAKPTMSERACCLAASEATEAAWVMVHWDGGKPQMVEAYKGGKPYKVLPPGLQVAE